jgi:subtilisin family serine protease
MSDASKGLGYYSKLAKKTYTFEPTDKVLTVVFPPKESDDPKVIKEYEKKITALIEEHSKHKDESDVDLQVTGINGRWGFARVQVFISDMDSDDENTQNNKKSKKLDEFSRDIILHYMPALVDKTDGNNNYVRHFLPDRFVLSVKKNAQQFFDGQGLKIMYVIDEKRGVYAVETKSSKKAAPDSYFGIIAGYNKDPRVDYAEPYEVGFKIALWEPKDEYYYNPRNQWGLRNNGTYLGIAQSGADMKVYQAWNRRADGSLVYTDPVANYEANGNYGDESVIVALIDYGVDTTHQDFTDTVHSPAINAIIDNGNQNFTGVGGTSIEDSSADGHGTHLAGIIGARHLHSTSTVRKVTGVVPFCKIMPLKINTDAVDYQQAVNAINYVITESINNQNRRYIICIGWQTGDNAQIRDALTDAYDNNNIVIVCAAGNSNANAPVFPAKHPKAIAAGAFSCTDYKWNLSNYGSNEAGEAVVFAPGESIWSAVKTSLEPDWDDKDGTSCAAAFLAGAAAALWSRDRRITGAGNFTRTNQNIKDLIRTNILNTDDGYPRHNLSAAMATIV